MVLERLTEDQINHHYVIYGDLKILHSPTEFDDKGGVKVMGHVWA